MDVSQEAHALQLLPYFKLGESSDSRINTLIALKGLSLSRNANLL